MWWYMNIGLLLGAFFIDLVVGDPPGIPHPVVAIGRGISFLEKKLYNKDLGSQELYFRGLMLTFIILIITGGAITGILLLALYLHPFLYLFFYLWFLSSTLAIKGLGKAGLDIYHALEKKDLDLARSKTGEIVGRDTSSLEEEEVVRAAVETVAENTVDGVTAPLFYAFWGGLPLALLYKAVNTLDSMVGYRNEKYENFGKASAKLDDLVNYIPARLTVVFMLLASLFMGMDWKRGWDTLKEDARKHPSPNSGYAEALAAGVLGIQLGGNNYYRGKISRRPLIGRELKKKEAGDILTSVRLMYLTSLLKLVTLVLLYFILVYLIFPGVF